MRPTKLTMATAVIVLAFSGCSSAAAPVSPSSLAAVPTSTAVPSPIPTVTATPTLAPTPVPGLANAQRIVRRLDELASLYAGGSADATGQRGNDEGAWVTSNMGQLLNAPALSEYTNNVIALLSAVAAGTDQADAVEGLVAMRANIAATYGLAAAVPTATPEPVEVAQRVGDRVVFTLTGDESNALWLTVVRVNAPWKSSNQFVTPDAGNKFLIAEVLFQGKSGEIDAAANEFTITDANGYVYDIAAMWKETSLP